MGVPCPDVVRQSRLRQRHWLEAICPMFRNTSIASLVILAAFGGCTLATAQEPKATSGKMQITNSIGMKLTLIPSGEFQMGSGESAEETATFFKKNYGVTMKVDDLRAEHPKHRVRITEPFYLGTYHVTRGQFRQFVKDSGYKTDAEKGEEPGAYGWNPKEEHSDFNKDYTWQNLGFEQTDEHPVVNVSWNDAVAYCKWLSRRKTRPIGCRPRPSGNTPVAPERRRGTTAVTIPRRWPKWRT